MKKRVLLLLPIILLGGYLCARAVRRVKLEVAYSGSLKSYSEVLKPGTSRSQVEAYLNTRNPSEEISRTSYTEGPDRGAWIDLIKIAEEQPNWPCVRRNIYIAFAFKTDGQRLNWPPPKEDRLVDVSLYRSVCLDLLFP